MNRIKKINKIIGCLIIMILFVVIGSSNTFARTITLDLNKGTITSITDALSGKTVKDGVYIISCAKDSNYVLDINDNSLDWGGNLQIWDRNAGDANQRFYISYEGNGYYKIASLCSGLILDVENSGQDNGVNIRQWEDNGASAQRWKINKNADGTYNFIAQCSGKALDVNGGVFTDGTNVQQWDYINSDAQKFNLEETELLSENIVSIKKAANYKVGLDVPNNSSNDGTALNLWEVNNSLAQRFEIHRVAKDEVRIRTVSSGGWLTETGKENGSEVVQLGNSSTPVSDANTWKVEWNNGITFKNKESGLYLDINSNSNDSGAKIQVWEKNNDQEAQRFLVNREHLIKDGWYEISSPLGTTMDLDNSGSDWGTNIIMWEKNNKNNQRFRITYTDSGYLITTMYGLALDVEDGSMDNGANVRQWEDNGATCQRWWSEVADGGYIRLRNTNSGKYLDVADNSSALGANVQQYEGNGSTAQLWKLTEKTPVGWFSVNGSMYCTDPQTGKLVTNCTRVDPTMTDPAQFGSIYDFDSEGRATWHLPTFDDLPGGHGKTAPLPQLVGDQRQRTLLLALSRVGCDYELLQAPTGFVCDGLTAWCVTNATGIRFRTGTRDDDQDMSWQYPYIKNKNGIKTDLSQAKPGDIMFWGDPANIENHATYGSRHASIYYHDGQMIHAASTTLGVIIGNLDNDLIGFGSPYDAETSKCELPN